MATIIQKPDSLSLSRNLKELIISTGSEISLQLLKEGQLLMEETYLPDANNRVCVDIRDIVTSALTLDMPSGDTVYSGQNSICATFTVKVNEVSMAEFTAIRSGVEKFSDTAVNFLTANWLTWQPQVKEVLRDQPEWLTYYPASGNCTCYAKFYYTDGTDSEIKVCDISQCVSINTRFSKLWSLDTSGKERYGIVDVYVKDAQGLRLTYVQRYLLRSQEALDEVYLCENSLGGLDTFRFYGDRKLAPEIGYTTLLLDNTYTAGDPDLSRKWNQNTGMLTDRESEWCWELFRSSAVFHLHKGTILPIVLDSSSIERSSMAVLSAYSFEYRYASDTGLLNEPRTESLPDIIEISGPDAEVFFLTPRLNEFPSAVLSDDLILPVQSPYEEQWYILSLGGIKATLLSSVEEIYGPMWHEHGNLQLLNLFSIDDYGRLLWNKEPLASGIAGHTDHAGELIRPAVLAIPKAPPSKEFGLLDGECYMYFDVVSAVDGETPTASGTGGLDVDELWSELGGSSDNRVISSEHLPEDVVYDADLDNYYSKSDSDARYVTLATEQVITGKKTFNNDVVFGGNGSKMFVPSTAGAGLYYMYFDVTSAVNGETPTASGGGLDVDELWAELGGSSSNKVIDISHIPHIPTSDISNYLFLNPNNGVHANQNDAVPANGRFAIYDANMATTAGGNDGYIMAFRWPSGNWATQVYLDVDNTGVMALRHRNNSNVWTDWHRIWHSGNDGSGSGLDADLLDGEHGSYYLQNVTHFKFKSTEYDANVDTSNGGVLYNYGDTGRWVNAPSGMSYGIIVPIMAFTGYSIAAELAFDISHNTSAGTRFMWYRARNSTGWATNWKKVLTDSNDIYTSGKLFVPSSEGNSKYYIRFE